jgi:hypothetical protein
MVILRNMQREGALLLFGYELLQVDSQRPAPDHYE